MAQKRYSNKNLTSGMKAAHFSYSKEHLNPDQLGDNNEVTIKVLTQAEYDAIPDEEKNNNNTLYFIKA